ncbi:class I SAM-dependent methyltransferase [Candidatus Poribacteria bacterium]
MTIRSKVGEMTKPFWEETYQDLSADTFGKPSAEIVRLAHTLTRGSSVLDMGCGEGRNALFLAEQGFQIDAIDISEAGIIKLLQIARDRELEINAWVSDMTTFQFGQNYDLIISHGVLHLAERDDWQQLIPRIKKFIVEREETASWREIPNGVQVNLAEGLHKRVRAI